MSILDDLKTKRAAFVKEAKDRIAVLNAEIEERQKEINAIKDLIGVSQADKFIHKPKRETKDNGKEEVTEG